MQWRQKETPGKGKVRPRRAPAPLPEPPDLEPPPKRFRPAQAKNDKRGKSGKQAKLSRLTKPEHMSLEDWQRELRRQFGREQDFRLKNLGDHPIFSEFDVTNPQTQRTYRVHVRGPNPGDNFCSCPDFATNTLGTCKHIEFTLYVLEQKRGGASALRNGFQPEYSEVFLQYGARREVRFRPGRGCPVELARLAADYFGPDGLLLSEAFSRFETFLAESARFDHDLRCYDDVRSFIAEVRDAEHRRQKIAEEFPRGARSAAFRDLLRVPLYEYQRAGALFAARAGRCLIGDEMGLGKTVQAIAAAEIMARLFGVGRVLVICPTSLKHQWQREIERFCDRSVEVINGLRHRRERCFATDTFFKVMNYDTVHRDLDLIGHWSPDLVILDEAQRIKNWNTRTARSVKRIASPYALVLTGTPLENRLEELMSIVQFVDRYRLGPTFRLLHEHQVRDEVGKVVGYRDLGRILSGTAQEAHWHLYPRCEWCEFFEHCRDEMRRTNDVSRLEQLTTYGKRHLVEEAGVRTLTDLGRFLKRADADEVLNRCASLAGQRYRLQVRVAALETAEPQLHGAASPDLPQGENVGLFLTLQQEQLGQTIYLTGLLVSAREDLRTPVFGRALAERLCGGQDKPQPCVWLAARPDDTAEVRRGFIELLHEVLNRVHRYNAEHPTWKDQLSLQAYVLTEQERGLLFQLLLEALQEPGLAEKAMTLLFHFQGPELMQADRHPGTEIAYPVVVLLNAVTRLLALPVEVSHTLPEMLEALGSSFHYRRKDYFHFPLGHGLRAEALHAAWYGGKKDNLDDIRQQARLYLFAVQALLRAVRQRVAKHLFAWPPKFALPGGAGIKDRILSRLAFFARYESLLSCLAVREARSEARPTQVLLGQVIELKALSAYEMEVLGELVVEPEANTFPSWLLVRDTDEGRRAQIEYADYWYRNKLWGGPDSSHRAIVGVQRVSTAPGGRALLRLNYARSFQGDVPRRGERFLLYPRFTDFTTDGLVRFLEGLDEEGGGLFLDLLRDPEGAAAPLPLPRKAAPIAEQLADALDFTPSQHEAYHAIGRQRVTAVWGPVRPGGAAVPRPGQRLHPRRHRKPAAQDRPALAGAASPPRVRQQERRVRPAPGQGQVLAGNDGARGDGRRRRLGPVAGRR